MSFSEYKPLSQDERAKSITVSEAVESLYFGAAQYKAFCGACLMWACISCFYEPITYLNVSFMNAFGWDEAEVGTLICISSVSVSIGCWISSVADSWGRRTTMVIALILITVLTPVQAYLSTFISFVVIRAIIGLNVGVIISAASAYFSEFLPIQDRGFWLTIFHISYPFGAMYTCVSVYKVRYDIANTFWLLGLPSLFGLLALYMLPESPRYLMLRGQHAEAEAIVGQMYVDNGVPVPSLHRPTDTEVSGLQGNSGEVVGFKAFRQDPKVWSTFVCIAVPWCLMAIASFGLKVWLPYYMHEQSKSKQIPMKSVMVMTGLDILGNLTAALSADRVDRRVLLSSGILFGSVSIACFMMTSDVRLQTLFGGLQQGFMAWAWLAYGLLACECFPTSCRVFAGGALRGVENVCAALSPMLAGYLFSLGYGLFCLQLYLGCYIASFILGLVMLRNMTMTGQSLADQVGQVSAAPVPAG